MTENLAKRKLDAILLLIQLEDRELFATIEKILLSHNKKAS